MPPIRTSVFSRVSIACTWHWTRTTVAGPPDAFMPALSADDTGASIVYYQRVPTNLLKALAA